MISHITRSLKAASVGSLTTVVGEGRDQVKARLDEEVRTVLQDKQLGTGHALKQVINDRNLEPGSSLLVTCGDIPGVRPSTYEKLIEEYETSSSGLVLLTTVVEDPEGYGRIKLDDGGGVEAIVEEVDATPVEKDINRINTGIMCGSLDVFERYLPELENSNEAGEYYLTDVVGLMNEDGRAVDYVEV